MELKEIPINKIHGNPLQPREYFDREKIKELANSIKEVGLINPIIVRERGKGYEIVAGERRFKAGQVAGKKTLPAIIKKLDNGQLMIESLIENVHREDLTDVEKAKALKIIMEREGIKTQSILAKKVGISERSIRMIFDSARIREEFVGPTKELSQSVISETIGLPKEERKKVIEKAAKEELGGRSVRKIVSVIKKSPESIKKAVLEKDLEPEIAERIMEIERPSIREKVLEKAIEGRITPSMVHEEARKIELQERKLVIEHPEEAYYEFTDSLTSLEDAMEKLEKMKIRGVLSKNQIDGMARSLYVFMSTTFPRFVKFLMDNEAKVDPRFVEYIKKFK